MTEHTPHPANSPGDFYVVDQCCTMCEAPFAEAPGMFGVHTDSAGSSHCFVKQQPKDGAELDQMIFAIRCAEVSCIRYRGTDRLVQLRLIALGEGVVCDELPADLEVLQKEMAEHRRQGPGVVSTLTVFGFLLTILAWEFEIGLLLVHLCKQGPLDPLAHAVLLATCTCLTLFAGLRGKREFHKLKLARGRIPITPLQGVLVTLFMICLGALLGWIIERLVNH